MKLNYRLLAIEVTRRCNFFCKDFCMRGPVQNLDINNIYIDKLLNNDIGKIYSINFTGGEPTLNSDAIEFCIDKIIKDKLDVIFIQMVSNGSNYDKNIANAFKRFNEYNNSREITGIKDVEYYDDSWSKIFISRDKYHDLKDDMSYKYIDDGISVYDKRVGTILKSGYSLKGELLDDDINNIRIYDNTVWNEIYLTSKGKLSSFADGSFDYIDKYASSYLIDDNNLDKFALERFKKSGSHPNKDIKKLVKK